jgi:hypothetical protein
MTSERETKVKNFTPTDSYSALFQAPVVEVTEGQWPVVLKTLEIQPYSNSLPQVTNNPLFKRFHETRTLSDGKNIPVRFLGYAPLFSGTRVYRGQGCDWAMMYLGNDPVYSFHKNKLYAPPPVITDITNIVNAGLKFDAIFIAHEIPQGSVKSGEKVPLELIAPPPSPNVQQRLQFIEDSSKGWWSFVTGAIVSALSAPSIAGVAAVGATAALVARDPVLFGVQFDTNWTLNNQPIGLWYYLTHWYWPAVEK